MIVRILAEGKKLIKDWINADADDFLKRMEHLYASVLNDQESFSQDCGFVDISLSVVGPEKIRELNLSYRDIDSPTDILSFPLWEEDSRFIPPYGWECLPLGDLVICPDKISENARENNKSFTEELVLVMSHGLLHLIGYDHYDKDSQNKMWTEQDRMVDQFFREEVPDMKDPEDTCFYAKSLLNEAKRAGKNAYVPYSSFPVGAAILFEDGSVVSGCNVENGSIGLSICAERNAMTTAVGEGRLKPVAIAVTGGSQGKICPPCGACRQFLSEFNSDMSVVLEEDGKPVIYKLSDLLPLQFKFSGKGEAEDDKQ